jgi:aspartate-semialdehyde dehydrogenase
MRDARVAVIGATGAVGSVTMRILRERGFENVRAFASARSAGSVLADGTLVEEATPDALAAGGIDIALFSVGTEASRELVPHAVRGGAVAIDKSSAYRLEPGIPLVVPEVNGDRVADHDGILANPNCCTIPLTCVLKPLHDAAGLRSVRVSTYQAASGKGAARAEQLRQEAVEQHDVGFDWTWEGAETDEESKIRAESQKVLELPELPISATTVRVPVLVGHAEAVWIELEDALAPERTPAASTRTDDVLVGRLRRDPAAENGLVLFLACDNLNKGAALNAVQIAERVLDTAWRPLTSA